MEIEVNQVRYRTGRLNAFQQGHIARKLIPVMSGLGETLSQVAKQAPQLMQPDVGAEEGQQGDTGEGGLSLEEAATTGSDEEDGEFLTKLWASIGPISHALRDMPDQDFEYVCKLALRTCMRYNGSTWAKVTDSTGNLMFDDINLMEMLQLVFYTLKDNLENFTQGLQQLVGGEAQMSKLIQSI